MPEFHAPPSEVEVWGMLSLLTHVTALPRANLIGFGEYAVPDSPDAPITIDTGVPGAAGGIAGSGVGDDVGRDVDPPQPMDRNTSKPATAVLILMVAPGARTDPPARV